jgi:hypothetical protein
LYHSGLERSRKDWRKVLYINENCFLSLAVLSLSSFVRLIWMGCPRFMSGEIHPWWCRTCNKSNLINTFCFLNSSGVFPGSSKDITNESVANWAIILLERLSDRTYKRHLACQRKRKVFAPYMQRWSELDVKTMFIVECWLRDRYSLRSQLVQLKAMTSSHVKLLGDGGLLLPCTSVCFFSNSIRKNSITFFAWEWE